MSGAQYPVDTLWQIADIPEEALPRFLAELPSMIAQIRSFKQVVADANNLFGEGQDIASLESTGTVWIDDDRGECKKTIAFDDSFGLPDLTVTHKLDGAA